MLPFFFVCRVMPPLFVCGGCLQVVDEVVGYFLVQMYSVVPYDVVLVPGIDEIVGVCAVFYAALEVLQRVLPYYYGVVVAVYQQQFSF